MNSTKRREEVPAGNILAKAVKLKNMNSKTIKNSKIMSVIIQPLTGIINDGKEIKFGITQKELKKILGEAPKIEIDNIMDEIREYRLGMIFTFIEKKLSDITFSLHVDDLCFESINIFQDESVISKLSQYDTPTQESKGGYINFYELGISLGGFGKRKIPEKKLVTVFPKERTRFYECFLKV